MISIQCYVNIMDKLQEVAMSFKIKTAAAVILTILTANALALTSSGNSFIDCRDQYINKCAPFDASKYNAQTSQTKLDAYNAELSACTTSASTLCSSDPKNKKSYQEYQHSISLAGQPAMSNTKSSINKLIA
jgi:hypothetical protein